YTRPCGVHPSLRRAKRVARGDTFRGDSNHRDKTGFAGRLPWGGEHIPCSYRGQRVAGDRFHIVSRVAVVPESKCPLFPPKNILCFGNRFRNSAKNYFACPPVPVE